MLPKSMMAKRKKRTDFFLKYSSVVELFNGALPHYLNYVHLHCFETLINYYLSGEWAIADWENPLTPCNLIC